MPRFKITNKSHTHKDGKRNIFLTEAGKMIEPGQHCVCNRLDNGTKAQIKAGILGMEEGDFKLPSIFDEPAKPTTEELAAAAKVKALAEAETGAKAEADAKVAAEEKAAMEARSAQAKANAEEAKAEAEAEAEAESKPKSKEKKNRGGKN